MGERKQRERNLEEGEEEVREQVDDKLDGEGDGEDVLEHVECGDVVRLGFVRSVRRADKLCLQDVDEEAAEYEEGDERLRNDAAIGLPESELGSAKEARPSPLEEQGTFGRRSNLSHPSVTFWLRIHL